MTDVVGRAPIPAAVQIGQQPQAGRADARYVPVRNQGSEGSVGRIASRRGARRDRDGVADERHDATNAILPPTASVVEGRSRGVGKGDRTCAANWPARSGKLQQVNRQLAQIEKDQRRLAGESEGNAADIRGLQAVFGEAR